MRQNRNRVRLQKRRKMFLMQQKRKRRRRRQQIFMRGTAAAMLLFAFCISIRFIHMAKDRPIVEGSTQEPVTTEVSTTETSMTESSGTGNVKETLLTGRGDDTTTGSVKNMDLKSDDKSNDFSDAVFVGDSRTEGFVLQTGIQTTAYVHKGLTVASAYTAKVIHQDDEDRSVMEALARTRYNRVYLMFGINETGWISNDIFISDYKQIIDDIKAQNPSAKIFIQSVLPVSKAVSDSGGYVRNDKIAEYNKRLEQLAADEGATFVNVQEAVSTDGVLPDDAATDGIHLNKKYCEKWLTYLEEHTLDK